jgi:hypothetical protein
MTRGWLLAATVAAASLGACELATKRSGLQCETTADCRAKGPDFAQTVCSSTGTCEDVIVPDAAAGSAGCASSQACSLSLGAPGRCVGGACVPMSASGVCTTLGPVTDDSAVLIAALVPQTGFAGSLAQAIAYPSSVTAGEPLLEGLLSEWNTAVQGDGGTAIGPRFGAVVCDESQLDASLQLFQKLSPQIILGPVSGAALQKVASQFSQTPIFSPLGDWQNFVQNPPTTNLHWFCSPNRASVVAPFQTAIDLVARYATTQPGHGSTVKLAIVQDSTEPNEADFLKSIKTGLTFNGESIQPGTNYQDWDIQADVTQQAGSFVAQAEQVAQFGPDVVVFTGPVWAQAFIYQIENRWLLAPQGSPRPLYLLYRGADALASYAGGAMPAVVSRIFALDVDRTGPVQQNYQNLLATETQLQTGFDNYVGSPFNDCLYAAMYATSAAAHAHSGTAAPSLLPAWIADGVKLIASQQPQGSTPSINLTTDGVPVGLGLVSSGAHTQLMGTAVSLGTDPLTGAPISQGLAISCIGTGNAGPSGDGGQAGDGGTPVAWESAGVSFGQDGNPIGDGGSDGGAPAVRCP